MAAAPLGEHDDCRDARPENQRGFLNNTLYCQCQAEARA